MSAPQADPLPALIQLLEGDSDLNEMVGGRIFGVELPSAEQSAMPRRAVVVRPSGGTGSIGQGYQEYGDSRYDVFCYSDSPSDAMAIWRQLNPILKQLRATVIGGCLLYWARPTSGAPITLRDPDTDWPYTLISYQVLAAEKALP